MDKKRKSFLKISTIVSWLIFLGLCVVIAEFDLNEGLENLVAILSIIVLVGAIALSVALKRTKSDKSKNKEVVDANIITGRKIYKKAVNDYFKRYIKLFLIVTVVLVVPLIIYYLINFNKVIVITLAVALVMIPAIALPTVYLCVKFFYFAYKEIDFNGETFVLFVSKERLSTNYYDPTFHVVYQEKEYVEKGLQRWLGTSASSALDVVDEVLFQTTMELLDWFSDNKFSNFIRIDIKSEKSGKLQCVYKIGTRKFIVTDKLEMLKGCYETSRSMEKEKKKQKKKK